VSFVVPCYNYARFLPDCLKGIFAQEGDFDFEVIIIDDGSVDATKDVLSGFRDPRLRVVFHAENRGHAATINEGLGLARGDFVARIDPDDRYRPGFLSTLVEKLRAYPDVGLAYGDAAIINEAGEITELSCDRVHGGRDSKGNEFIALLEDNFICSPTVIARRQAWQKALPVPAGLAFHDWYFTLQMAREYDFYYVNRVVADYRVHPDNHHSKIVISKKEEPSIFWLLDSVFGQQEKSAALQREKRRAKSRVYGAHYFTLADKYFGFRMGGDARRCYLGALRHRPRYIFSLGLLRRLLATFIGARPYEYGKAFIKNMLGRNHPA